MSEEIDVVAVLGAGTMGRGIAYAAACAGYETRLFDPEPAALTTALAAIADLLDKGVERGKVEPAAARLASQRLTAESTIESAVGAADLVIEAAPESLELKLEIFSKVTAAAPAGALLASNTSALSITELAAATDRPQRFAEIVQRRCPIG